MAVKFSQFTTATQLSDVSHLVGYKGTANVQIPPSLIAGTSYTLDVPATTFDINLAGSDGSNDAISLIGGTNITLAHTSTSSITINGADGDKYNLDAATSGSNVNLRLTSDSGTDDSAVLLTAGTGMTITQSGGNNVTLASAAGVTMTKDQFTGNNSTIDFILSVTPTATDNLNIYISGVYQNSLDASGGPNYSLVGGTTLRFATAPPTTAANGIEVVITE